MHLHSFGASCTGRVEGGEGDDTVSCPLLSSLLDVSAVKWFTVVKLKTSSMSKNFLLYLQQLTKHVLVNVRAMIFLTQKIPVT